MFGKLMKYEIRGNSKVLFPAFGLGIGGGLILQLCSKILNGFSERIGGMAEQLFSAIVGLYAGAVAVFGIGYIVVRFYRSMVGREAYLTLTLPVGNTLHVAAKFVSGFGFGLLSLAAARLTYWTYAPTSLFGLSWKQGELQFYESLTGGQWLQMNGMILLFLAVMVAFLLMELFFCCGIGSQFKSKVVASVVTYFVAHNAVGLVGLVALVLGLNGLGENRIPQWVDELMAEISGVAMMGGEAAVFGRIMGLAWIVVLVYALYSLLWGAGYFFVTRHMFNKRVNLD